MVTAKRVDMSAKIGGRTVEPLHPPVDVKNPTPLDLSFQKSLQAYVGENVPMETDEGIQRRERALTGIEKLSREWIRTVCTRKGHSKDVIESAGGKLFTSGSYRLGIHEPGADIDAIVVAPNFCLREDFFGVVLQEREDGSLVRDPESLSERLRTHPHVTNFNAVTEAAVPILTFDWEGVNIDLLFATINKSSVPANLDIDKDTVLDGVDTASEKSLNGPRVTNIIAALVSGTPERLQNFLMLVRCLRKWAKARGLYANKLGYWGGININIAAAFVIQLYPLAPPATLIRMFFRLFSEWRWPRPIRLTKIYDAGYGLAVWNEQQQHHRQVAPMITPAYPAMNSTLSVSRQTFQIFQEEILRGDDLVMKMWRQHQAHPSQPLDWNKLFEPSDFFIKYPNYLSLCIVAQSQSDVQKWKGFVESRLRKLVSDNLGRSLPLSKIQLWPKTFAACIADKTAFLTHAQREYCETYFIGFCVDMLRMRGTELNVEQQLQYFRNSQLASYQGFVEGMDIMVKAFRVKELPKLCFESMGGKIVAMKKRREIRNADPRLKVKRELAAIEKKKAKLAELQKKKEANRAVAEGDEETAGAKRKREDDEDAAVEEPDAKVAKTEEEKVDDSTTQISEEEDLLQRALDTIQQDDSAAGTKTREEAEADRRKLLAGELLVEGGSESDEEEETGYTGDGARMSFLAPKTETKKHDDIRSLPMSKEQADVLRKLGCPVDEEIQVIGADMVLPWRKPVESKLKSVKIVFNRKFEGLVELDANGHIVDKGDEDFTPSKEWTGRKAGFEFKLGERGLGYYRTGKKVVVPSNTAY